MLFHQFHDGVGIGLLRKVEAQIAAALCQFWTARNAAQAVHPCLAAHVAQHRSVTFAAHLVEDDPNQPQPCVIVFETLQQRHHRPGGTAGLHHQHNGQVEQTGHFGTRAAAAFVAVEQSHHALDDAHVGIGCIAGKGLLHPIGPSHEEVEIDTRTLAGTLVKFRINIVGAALEGLHTQAAPMEQSHQPQGHGGFSTATARGGNHKCCIHARSFVHLFANFTFNTRRRQSDGSFKCLKIYF